jgi:hypothetical protein
MESALKRWEEDVAAMHAGTRLYLSNELAQAEALFQRGMAGREGQPAGGAVAADDEDGDGASPRASDDAVERRDTRGAFALQYAIVGLLRGIASLQDDQLLECRNRLWEADRLAALDAPWVGRKVVRGVCIFVAGLVQCMQRDPVRGVWHILRSWQYLRHLRSEALEYDGVGREIVRSAALMSLGAFALVLSLLPPQLVRAASWSTGFEIDRATGLDLLRTCQREGGIYAPIAALGWLAFHIDSKTFLGETQLASELDECAELLAWASADLSPASLFFGILEADMHACRRDTAAALTALERLLGLGCLDELKAIHAVLQYKRALYHLARLEFAAAASAFATSQAIYKASGRRSLGPAMALYSAHCHAILGTRQADEPEP